MPKDVPLVGPMHTVGGGDRPPFFPVYFFHILVLLFASTSDILHRATFDRGLPRPTALRQVVRVVSDARQHAWGVVPVEFT